MTPDKQNFLAVVRSGVVRGVLCGVVCGALHGFALCGVWCAVVCGMVCYGVVLWCGVVWCGAWRAAWVTVGRWGGRGAGVERPPKNRKGQNIISW